jgi:hypothetical protein
VQSNGIGFHASCIRSRERSIPLNRIVHLTTLVTKVSNMCLDWFNNSCLGMSPDASYVCIANLLHNGLQLIDNPGSRVMGVQSNFLGTDFHVYDSGERGKALNRSASRGSASSASAAMTGTAESSEGRGSGGTATRKEIAVVQYHMNVMGTKGPRKMTIGIPYVDFDTNEPAVWCGESMMPWYAPAESYV